MKTKHPKVIVAGVVEKNGKFLLIREKLASGDFWIIPGGTVEFGESLEEALKREIKEETGFEIEVKNFLSHKEAIFPNYNYHTVIFFYHVFPISGELILETKASGGQFFTKDEIKNLQLVESAQWVFNEFEL